MLKPIEVEMFLSVGLFLGYNIKKKDKAQVARWKAARDIMNTTIFYMKERLSSEQEKKYKRRQEQASNSCEKKVSLM
jgi:hypothetical protein